MRQLSQALLSLSTVVVLAACGTSQTETTASAAEPTTTTTQANTPIEPAETSTAPSTTFPEQPVNQWPEWVQSLPFEIDNTNSEIPDSLAFTDEFRDPGLNFRISISPDWTFGSSQGPEVAPLSEWKLNSTGTARLRVTSVALPGTPFNEFVSGLQATMHYEDDEVAVATETVDDAASGITFSVIKLYRASHSRVAFAQLSFPSDNPGYLNAALPYLLTFERTPWEEADQGSATQQEVDYWLNQFDSMSDEDLARYGTPEVIAECVADGYRSARMERYAGANLNPETVDSTNREAVLTLSNYFADQEELGAFCGMPPNSFGTYNS